MEGKGTDAWHPSIIVEAVPLKDNDIFSFKWAFFLTMRSKNVVLTDHKRKKDTEKAMKMKTTNKIKWYKKRFVAMKVCKS